MERNKYLIVAENNSAMSAIKKVYDQMGEMAEFDADFTSIDCEIENTKSVIASSRYYSVVNACNVTNESELDFRRVITELGLEKYRVERIYLFTLDDSVIESELMTLNEY